MVRVEADRNFAVSGELVKLAGSIDHSKGREKIKEALIKLEERRVMIASGGEIRDNCDAEYYFGQTGKISPG